MIPDPMDLGRERKNKITNKEKKNVQQSDLLFVVSSLQLCDT